MRAQHIVILGGGFAGVEVARQLERRLPPEHSISLLSRENYITYNPLLAEAVGASILPGYVVAPLRQMVKRTRLCMVTVTDIDSIIVSCTISARAPASSASISWCSPEEFPPISMWCRAWPPMGCR